MTPSSPSSECPASSRANTSGNARSPSPITPQSACNRRIQPSGETENLLPPKMSGPLKLRRTVSANPRTSSRYVRGAKAQQLSRLRMPNATAWCPPAFSAFRNALCGDDAMFKSRKSTSWPAARAAGHEVDFLDLNMASSPQRALRKALKAGGHQAVAFGIRNLDNCWAFAPRTYLEEVRGFAEIVRHSFNGPLILGGSGFSVSPVGWMRRLQADCGVIGEGEPAVAEVLSRLEAGRSLEGIDGVIVASKSGSLADVLPTKAVEGLDTLAMAAHELCGYAKYMRRGGYVGVQTKRGCPFGCIYCVYPQLEGKRYRRRPPEASVGEVEAVVVRSKVRHSFFVDSVFNDPRAHALEICQIGR